MDLIKKDGTWSARREIWSSFDVAPNLRTLPVSGDPEEHAHYYVACMDPFDAMEENRRFYGGADAADDYRFWARGFRSKQAAIDFGFGNVVDVVAASSSEVVESGPGLRQPAGRIDDLAQFIAEMDGYRTSPGDLVLVKDQWYETLTQIAFDGAGTKTVSINNVLNDKDELFTQGNTVVFFNSDGEEVLRDTITNLVLPTISGTPYVVFNTLATIPDDALYCADLVDGEWTRTTLYDENGVYEVTQVNPGENTLVYADCMADQESMHNLVLWVRNGAENGDSTWYLQRDTDGYYPAAADDKVFAAANMSLVKMSVAYDATESTHAYPAVRMKALLTDVPSARVLGHQSGFLPTLAFTVGTQTLMTLDYSDAAAVPALVRSLYDDASVQPHMEWAYGTGKAETFTQADYPYVDVTASVLTWHTTPGTNLAGGDVSQAGDFVRITVYDDSDGSKVLDHIAVVQAYNGTTDMTFWPELPPQAVTDVRSVAFYTARVENLSVFSNLADLGQALAQTPLGLYYELVREADPVFGANVPLTGFAGDYDLQDGTRVSLRGQFDPDENGDYDVAVADGTYTLTDAYVGDASLDDNTDTYMTQVGKHYVSTLTTVTTDVGATGLVYEEEVYNPAYAIGDMLRQTNPPSTTTAFDGANDLGSATVSYSYKNTDGTDRFGYVRNSLYLGSAQDLSPYVVGTWLLIQATGKPDIVRRVVGLETDGDYTVVRLNEAIDASLAPSTGVNVDVRERFVVDEIDADISVRSGSLEAYNRMLADNAQVNANASVIFTEGAGGQMVLFKDAPGVSGDPRLYVEPSALLHVGTDGEIGETLFVDSGDWFVDDDGKLHIEPGEDTGRIRFIDGLKEKRILDPNDPQHVHAWILRDTVVVTGAVVGCTKVNGLGTGDLVWYKGDWRRGTWEGGTWLSGTWRGGTWNGGTWKSVLVVDNGGQNVSYVASNTKNTYSSWQGGTWLSGTWEGGTFSGGSWTTGTWKNGAMTGGTWGGGTWENGTFETATWLDGTWLGGDFKNGTWVTGTFDQSTATSRFGTGATASAKAIWQSGTWNGGQFHSGLNAPGGFPLVSEHHEYSLWWSGTWNGGDWYGGTLVYGTWNASVSRPSTWHGGVWIGGYPVTSVADRNSTTKTVTVDITPTWLSITGDLCPGHGIRTGQKVVMLADVSSTVTDAHKQLFANIGMNTGSAGSVAGRPALPTQAYRTVTGTSGATTLYVTSPDVSLAGTTYYSESADRHDGNPYLASVWNGGTWMGGVWMGGVFNGGSFEGGLWGHGLMSYGRVGYQP